MGGDMDATVMNKLKKLLELAKMVKAICPNLKQLQHKVQTAI